MKSKEDNLLELFFNYPAKHWHFKEIKEKVDISDTKLVKWLNRFKSESLIKRIKERGKMPYYIGNYESPDYKNRKKIFALNKLYKSGFLNHLMSLKEAKTVILFGSIARGDWYEGSDVDLFIYGDDKELDMKKYEKKLKKDIQLFSCKNKKELKRFGSKLIRNIIRGDFIKGDVRFLNVMPNA